LRDSGVTGIHSLKTTVIIYALYSTTWTWCGKAQAILTGQLDDNGVFYASELLLKCPSRYEEVAPLQAEPEA
jgi:hypothetical protein